jgi:diguanylate cyclase (GGDEF)-like protein/PAS domain S-box-containing protein
MPILKFVPSSTSTLLASVLITGGWLGVIWQSLRLEASTIETYQHAQLEVVHNAARAAQVYMSRELEDRGLRDLHRIEQEVFNYFVKPIKIGTVGDAWIYSPEYVIFDESEDFPDVYKGKSMAEIFVIQQSEGASHYEAMTAAVMTGKEGVGWYVWMPNKARESAPWWEFITRDAGREIAAWTPIVVSPGTAQERTWVIGMSSMLPELMQLNGAYSCINTSLVAMSIATGFSLALLRKLRQQEKIIREREAQYRAVVEDQSDLISRYTLDFKLTFANRAYAEAFGKEPDELIGGTFFDSISESDRGWVIQNLTSMGVERPCMSHEHRMIGADHQIRWHHWTNRLLIDDNGRPMGFQSVGRDITSLKAHEAAIEKLAFTDALTGLANRRQLYLIGEKLLQEKSLAGASLSAEVANAAEVANVAEVANAADAIALIFIDLNRFKTINDTLGHDIGDALLIAVGQRIQSCLRQQDLLARLGGDEFAILLYPITITTVKDIARRIVQGLKASFEVQGHQLFVESGLGIALTIDFEITFSDLMTQADIAMYHAKVSGGTDYVLFDHAMQAAVIARANLEKELHKALKQDELTLWYQPIVALNSLELSDHANHCPIIGFEALIRWQHPEQGLLSPGNFLAVAADMGLSLMLDRWVLQQACQQLIHWHPDRLQGRQPTLSVNLSSAHLAQSDLVDYIAQLLASYPIKPQQLIIEITEEVMIRNPERVVNVLERLRHLGVRASLDDFGTGYSSLSYLHQFPVNSLKIDRSFVHQLSCSRASTDLPYALSQNETIIRAIINLAHNLGIRTIAEGIETPHQLKILQDMGCEYAQGYYFFHPADSSATNRLLMQQTVAVYPTQKHYA